MAEHNAFYEKHGRPSDEARDGEGAAQVERDAAVEGVVQQVPALDIAEMRAIAAHIARDPASYPSARISALRFLRELDGASESEARDAFSDLDELAPRRKAGGPPKR